MKTIIAGSRTCTNMKELGDALINAPFNVTTVICGKARGADTLGEQYAITKGLPLEYYPANWDKYGKQAGYIRNLDMAEAADALIAIWDGSSRGTAHMIKQAVARQLQVYVYEPAKGPDNAET